MADEKEVDATTKESLENARRNAGIVVTSGDLEADEKPKKASASKKAASKGASK